MADEPPSSRPSARLGTALILPGQAGARAWGACGDGRRGSLSSGGGGWRRWVPGAGPEEPPGRDVPSEPRFPLCRKAW